jgi:hypothetical protein
LEGHCRKFIVTRHVDLIIVIQVECRNKLNYCYGTDDQGTRKAFIMDLTEGSPLKAVITRKRSNLLNM